MGLSPENSKGIEISDAIDMFKGKVKELMAALKIAEEKLAVEMAKFQRLADENAALKSALDAAKKAEESKAPLTPRGVQGETTVPPRGGTVENAALKGAAREAESPQRKDLNFLATQPEALREVLAAELVYLREVEGVKNPEYEKYSIKRVYAISEEILDKSALARINNNSEMVMYEHIPLI